MRYFCLIDEPLESPLRWFMQPVSTDPIGEGVRNLGERYPELAGRSRELGLYATLFGVRRLLQEQLTDPDPADDGMVGIAHQRRYMVTRPAGTMAGNERVLSHDAFAELPDAAFLPPPGRMVMPLPVDQGTSMLARFGADHHARDLLHFMAIAVERGAIGEKVVGHLLGRRGVIPTPAVGIYPMQWLVQVLEYMETVVDVFQDTVAVERNDEPGSAALCCERLHSVYLEVLVGNLQQEQILAIPPLVVGEERAVTTAGESAA